MQKHEDTAEELLRAVDSEKKFLLKKELSLKFTGMTGAITEMDLEEVMIERRYEVDICLVQDT